MFHIRPLMVPLMWPAHLTGQSDIPWIPSMNKSNLYAMNDKFFRGRQAPFRRHLGGVEGAGNA
jgi:hypothetical protein